MASSAAATAAGATVALPEIYSFPPFFTLQPNDAVRAKQLQEWRNLIVAWHEARKETTMVVADWPLWENKAIGRRLDATGVAAVMQFLVDSGNGDWDDAAHTRARVLYRSPAEWASSIWAYAQAHGLQGSMFTVYDLVGGDTTTDAEFYGLDPNIMVKALRVLQRDSRADVFDGASPDEVAVKFRAAS